MRPVVGRASQRVYQFQNWFFRGRYLFLARLLGLESMGDESSPHGTLLIEIDGLGHASLQRAMELGYMPFTRRLLERGRYRLHRWRCGLAADTPPIQSGLMYGTAEGVVGFYWWDRKTQRRVVGANPYHMRAVQAELAERARAMGNEGLLEGGSSYSNIMSGGAQFSVLTIAGGGLSGASRHWFTPGQGLMRALTVLLLNPGKVLRFLIDAAWELAQEMEDRVVVNAMQRPRILEGAFPILRVLFNVLAREIVTAGTRVDMLRGVPVIYSCYIGYDVLGHHSGPLSRNSMRVLRGIDGAIRKLYMTRAWTHRRYELGILSDHGMSPCLPVEHVFESDFDTWVNDWWRQGAQATPAYRDRRRRVRFRLRRRERGTESGLGRLAGEVMRRNSGWLRTWGRLGAWTLELGSAGAIKLGERFLEDDVPSALAPHVTVINCGPLSQIWVKEVDRRLDLSQVDEMCPGFVDALVDHPAMGLVVGRQGEEIVARGRRGTAYLRPLPHGPDGIDFRSVVLRIDGEDPFIMFEEPDIAALQTAAFASADAVGDVICMAALFTPQTLADSVPGASGRVHVYTFENQMGTHASIGGDQSYPFIVLPSWMQFDGDKIVSATQMYPVLKYFTGRATKRESQ
ncbi:MAG TPA: alkaline phosphatase family protein [Chloroflexota bacterium]|nr:alkaline phosphatase family protein [Chloroflexota bacterium]